MVKNAWERNTGATTVPIAWMAWRTIEHVLSHPLIPFLPSHWPIRLNIFASDLLSLWIVKFGTLKIVPAGKYYSATSRCQATLE